MKPPEFFDIDTISAKLNQKGRPLHIVSAFFNLGDCYKPNTAPEYSLSLNKVGKDIGPYKYLILINRLKDTLLLYSQLRHERHKH